MPHTPSIPSAVQWSLPWVLGKKAARPTSYDALISWTPPALKATKNVRKPLNLALVIDRSGSMDDTLDGAAADPLRRWAKALPAQPAVPQRPAPWVRPIPDPWEPGVPFPWEPQPMWLTHQGNLGGPLENMVRGQAPALNLGLDKAAAMGHLDAYQMADTHRSTETTEASKTKLALTVEAAWAAIQTLGADDRVAIITFDNHVKVVCAGVSGTDRAVLRRALDSIVSGSTTALFDGWAAGARAVAESMTPDRLNRVIVLTDGKANHGETSQDRIASRLAELAETGVSTTTFGMGRDYDEDMLQAMAQAGDGNYYYIRGTDDFLTLFDDEFSGIARVAGRKVRARVEAEGWADTPDLLNEFPVDADGWSRLPNLMYGQALTMALRCIPGKAPGTVRVRLKFEDVHGVEHEQVLDAALPTAKTASTPNQTVVDRVASLLVAREKKKAVAALDRGDLEQATTTLRGATAYLNGASAAMACASTQTLNMLAEGLETGDRVSMRKTALYQTYNDRVGKTR